MRAVRLIKWSVFLALAAFGALLLYGWARHNPEDLPWTSLDLTQPVGAFTGPKLAALGDQPRQCRALLRAAGVRFQSLPERRASDRCGYDNAVRFGSGGSLEMGCSPADLATACPVAAALALWEWHVVQPAALRHLGSCVASIDHFGSYSCRRLYGRSEGGWSEHSAANAVDVAGFKLENGRRISVAADWSGEDTEAAFLAEVRDGACDLFATVLSPDYNEAHRDHLHFDQADRGRMGWRGCR